MITVIHGSVVSRTLRSGGGGECEVTHQNCNTESLHTFLSAFGLVRTNQGTAPVVVQQTRSAYHAPPSHGRLMI